MRMMNKDDHRCRQLSDLVDVCHLDRMPQDTQPFPSLRFLETSAFDSNMIGGGKLVVVRGGGGSNVASGMTIEMPDA